MAKSDETVMRGPSSANGHGPRVLLLTASAKRRGAEIQATQLAERLTALGVDVRVTALSLGTDDTPLPISHLGRSRLSPTTLWSLRKLARDHDVVVAYGSTTLPACSIALAGSGVPFLYRSVSDPTHWIRGGVHRFVTRLQYRRAALIVALWEAAGQSFVDELGVDAGRIRVISNARDPEHYRAPTRVERDEARETLGVSGRHVVAFIGSLAPEKRVDRAVATLEHLPDCHLLLAGGGQSADVETVIADATERLGNRITALGEVTDVRPVLRAADVVLITSDVEGMPGVAIEAALSGVRTVATSVGALPTMPGVETTDHDPIALAAAVQRALDSDPVDPVSAEGVTWPVVADEWRQLLERFSPSGIQARP